MSGSRFVFLEGAMLYWAAVFFIIAIIAGVLGFTGIAIATAEIAKILFFVFLILFALSIVASLVSRAPPPVP
jgi:uncharacterized membrane protein YtjA (UPF0391 family)